MRGLAKSINTSKVFFLLKNSRRRALIEVLQQVGGEACLREIVRRVAEKENGAPPDSKLRKSVYASMVQSHLPKLSLAGLVEYNSQTDTVHLIDLPSSYRYHLEAVQKGDVPWCLYYLALSAAGVLSGLLYSIYGGFSVGSLLILIFSALVLAPSLLHTARTYRLDGNESLPPGNETIPKRVHRHRKDNEKNRRNKKE